MENDDTEYPVRYIPASKVLQAKVPFLDVSPNIALKKANNVLEEMAKDYVNWVQEDIKRLESTYQDLCEDPKSKDAITALYRVSYAMKGQGGTFGYDLVTFILNNLCRYLEEREEFNEGQLELIELHIESVRMVITHELTGKGGEMGKQVIMGLKQMINKKG
ncbi:MAG: hypothetical protein HOL37_01910 [Rhodospirillaceae bacterium]|jgi:hypothetical protein|nr:hypothetical protein [Rhodospirillaceae bacterium]MBT5308066.1 hypothetical protein [Rhodospirillaceae bacterium]MBT7357019.1 hypothetical protein [Rhodospirillaceae bacterium]